MGQGRSTNAMDVLWLPLSRPDLADEIPHRPKPAALRLCVAFMSRCPLRRTDQRSTPRKVYKTDIGVLMLGEWSLSTHFRPNI